MNCKEARMMMHEYLDGHMDRDRALFLIRHIEACRHCRIVLTEFEKVEGLIRSLRKPEAPDGLKQRIMSSLPPERRRSVWFRWVRNHPAASVAVVFVVVMLGSVLSLWDQSQMLAVRGDDLDQVVIVGNEVIVPEGRIVRGDLTVENGTLQVYGEVQGNLVVIDGNVLQASTAQVSGDVIKVDRALDWIWYQVSIFLDSLAQ